MTEVAFAMGIDFPACLLMVLTVASSVWGQQIAIPAFTAYSAPDIHAVQVNEDGISGWDSADSILWGGELKPGNLEASVAINLPVGESSKLKLTIGGQSREATVNGAGQTAAIAFGKFDLADGGYQRITLAGVSKTGKTFGQIKELDLSGPAAREAFFNLKPRRNAASVHLSYPLPQDLQAAWFYNELTPRTDPTASYYMACGFSRGYFGIQVNSPTERRVIFSVWDSGQEPTDRKNLAKADLVSLLAKGDGVEAGSFGNEGTGAHSHLIYNWKTNETQRFLVAAKADGDATIYSAYYFFNDRKKWGLIASFRAPHDGKLLRGLYSFNEDFDGSNGHLQRLCEFGNQWVKSAGGQWSELTTAHFSHDATGGTDRRDFEAGVTPDGKFFLSNGGFIAGLVHDRISRPATGKEPDVVLPE